MTPRRQTAGIGWAWLVCLLCLALARPALPTDQTILAVGFYSPVIRDLSRQDVEISLRYWVDELASTAGVETRPMRFYDDIPSLRRDVESGVINFLVITAIDAIRHFSPGSLKDGFAGYKHTPDHLLLVVRKDARIAHPGDLAGKRLVLLDDDELSQLYLETLLLKAWGQADWQRLGPVAREARSLKLIHRLFFGQADATLIHRNAYDSALALNPQIQDRLQILEAYTFPSRSHHIGLFSARVPEAERERISLAALALNDTPRGRQMLNIYRADELVRSTVKDLEPFHNLLDTHRALRSRAAGKRGSEPK